MKRVAHPISDNVAYLPRSLRPVREPVPTRVSVLAIDVEANIPWRIRRAFRVVQDGKSAIVQYTNTLATPETCRNDVHDAERALMNAGYQALSPNGFDIYVSVIPALPCDADDEEITDVSAPPTFEAGTCCGAPTPDQCRCAGAE